MTTGAAQSNYARLTAAAARRLGLEVVLVLAGDGAGAGTGNLTLDGLFGAEIHWAGECARTELDERAAAIAEELRARGRRPALLPYGGSNALGALGYLGCAKELREQAPDGEHFVVAVGSGATMAGLLCGLGAQRVLGVDAGAVPDAPVRVRAIATELAQLSDEASAPEARLRVDGGQVGGGYEHLTEQARQAMLDGAQCEGLVLDPVYTAKAMAGLIAAVQAGEIRRGQRTVFVHTGGLPGLFGHPLAEELAGATRARSS